MITKKIEHFNLKQICNSGQCFRMNQIADGRYSVIAGQEYLEVEQQGMECCFYCEEEAFENFWKAYFDLEGDYHACIGRIDPKDIYLTQAAAFGEGIRILKQELWETIISFLISQQNNIVRIRRCIQNICEGYGEKRVNLHGGIYYGFPTAEALAELGEDDLKACNLGYRSKYVVRTAKSVVCGATDLGAVYRLPYDEARGNC